MAQRRNAAEAEDLARLSEEVERWRRTRAKLSPMPAPLWRAAIALARRLGVNPVKNALGLNYTALRTRVEARGEVATSAGTSSPRFVELAGAQVLGAPAAPGSVVEVCDAHGSRLTVRLVAGAQLDVARLVESFRRPSA
jgi:hypothetical protein